MKIKVWVHAGMGEHFKTSIKSFDPAVVITKDPPDGFIIETSLSDSDVTALSSVEKTSPVDPTIVWDEKQNASDASKCIGKTGYSLNKEKFMEEYMGQFIPSDVGYDLTRDKVEPKKYVGYELTRDTSPKPTYMSDDGRTMNPSEFESLYYKPLPYVIRHSHNRNNAIEEILSTLELCFHASFIAGKKEPFLVIAEQHQKVDHFIVNKNKNPFHSDRNGGTVALFGDSPIRHVYICKTEKQDFVLAYYDITKTLEDY